MSAVDEGGRDVDELYEYAVSRDTRWRNRKNELKSELLGETEGAENETEKKIEEAIRTAEKHDELLTAVASAFHRRSYLTEETGWRVLGIEPLYEIDPSLRNPDAIIGHPDRDIAIIVECKTGLSSPRKALTQIRGAADNVLEYGDYLADKTGFEFDDLERVLMVPSGLRELAQRAIDRETREEDPEEDVLLWTYHTFNEERLQIYRNFNERSETDSTHNSRLSQQLTGEGVRVINDPLATGDFYPESSPITILKLVFFEVASRREASDASIRRFTREEMHDVMDNQRIMTHYDTSAVADFICDDLLSRMLNYQLIKQIDPEEDGYGSGVDLYAYQDKIEGKTATTIQSNLRDQYRSAWMDQKAEKDAKERTVDEFLDGQTGLSDHF